MSDLTQQKCEACRADAPRVTLDDSKELLKQIPEWEIMPQDSIDRLTRIFKFDDYLEAVSFSNKVAELARAVSSPVLVKNKLPLTPIKSPKSQ